jgi:hypothetical protein
MAGKDLRREPLAARILAGADPWRIVPAEFHKILHAVRLTN